MYRSEYAVNFREPAQYVYENGAWKAGGGTNAQLQAAQVSGRTSVLARSGQFSNLCFFL